MKKIWKHHLKRRKTIHEKRFKHDSKVQFQNKNELELKSSNDSNESIRRKKYFTEFTSFNIFYWHLCRFLILTSFTTFSLTSWHFNSYLIFNLFSFQLESFLSTRFFFFFVLYSTSDFASIFIFFYFFYLKTFSAAKTKWGFIYDEHDIHKKAVYFRSFWISLRKKRSDIELFNTSSKKN